MSPILTIARFNVAPSRQEEFLARRPAAIKALREEAAGFLGARFARVEGGVWVDVLEWESREQAVAAAETIMMSPDVQAWAEHIGGFLSFERGDLEHEA